jgi:hypothetical protein
MNPLNQGAAVAYQADVLNWRDVNDRFPLLPGFVMRSVLSATLMMTALGLVLGLIFSGRSAQAQMTPPSTAGTKPKPVATEPIRPALQKPEDTAKALSQAERLALQSDLAWVGQYNGAITGDVSERMINAIKEFQKSRGGKPTGALNPQERGALADTARK